jgi:hypothetical protein
MQKKLHPSARVGMAEGQDVVDRAELFTPLPGCSRRKEVWGKKKHEYTLLEIGRALYCDPSGVDTPKVLR